MSNGEELPPSVGITFTEDWVTICDGDLFPGCSLVLFYNIKRLIDEVSTDGPVDCYAEFTYRKRGSPITKLLSPSESPFLLSTTVVVPVYCREITVWFKVCKENKQWEYDSNSGKNYTFSVRGNAIMAFRVNEDVQTRGHLTLGGTLKLCYDSRRLPGRDFYRGEPCWDIQAVATFKEFGLDTRKVMQATNDDVDPIMITEFEIPNYAEFVAIWFKHWGHFSGDTYDTNGERNYVHSFLYDGELFFTKEMTTVVKGFLLAGAGVCVSYDTNRIFVERPAKKKTDASIKWLKLGAKFNNDGAVVEKDFGEVRKNDSVKTVLEIPDNAVEIVLWFTYGDMDAELDRGKVSFDSMFGENYHFEILP